MITHSYSSIHLSITKHFNRSSFRFPFFIRKLLNRHLLESNQTVWTSSHQQSLVWKWARNYTKPIANHTYIQQSRTTSSAWSSSNQNTKHLSTLSLSLSLRMLQFSCSWHSANRRLGRWRGKTSLNWPPKQHFRTCCCCCCCSLSGGFGSGCLPLAASGQSNCTSGC